MHGRILFSPIEMNRYFKNALTTHGWCESRTSYWVTADAKLIRKTIGMTADQQKAEIMAAGHKPLSVME